MDLDSKPNVGGRWKLQGRLGSGAFGEVYAAIDVVTREVVAAKTEKVRARDSPLNYEQKVYKWLHGSDPPVHGLPRHRWYGQCFNFNYNVFVMDCLGPSLEDRMHQCKGQLSLKAVLMIGIQALYRIQYVHDRSFVHRDLKPENMLMGINDNVSVVYIVDFGLAKRYRDEGTLRHKPFKDRKPFKGTARYSSINTHLGTEQSRRDDLESLGYIIVYLYKGRLPWQGLQATNEYCKRAKICDKKKHVSLHQLCQGMPSQVVDYLRCVRNMRFEEEPDYRYLRKLFRKAMEHNGCIDDGVFDWMGKSSSD